MALPERLGGSVGFNKKSGLGSAHRQNPRRKSPDVEAVQTALSAYGLGDVVGIADGQFGPRTLIAIRRFQSVATPGNVDGLVGNLVTWPKLKRGGVTVPAHLKKRPSDEEVAEVKKEMSGGGAGVRAAPGLPTPAISDGIRPARLANGRLTGDFYFPLANLPTANYTGGGREFGASRGSRTHAGCDLYTQENVSVYAVTDGTFLGTTSAFAGAAGHKVGSIIIKHGDKYICRYGEVTVGSWGSLRAGDPVYAGQKIGEVGLTHYKKGDGSYYPAMLHFELFRNTSATNIGTLSAASGRYRRRDDLMNPTDELRRLESFIQRSRA
jgi:murein DD-endopeptidase MepM/ murein hydrolase activator NlpD